MANRCNMFSPFLARSGNKTFPCRLIDLTKITTGREERCLRPEIFREMEKVRGRVKQFQNTRKGGTEHVLLSFIA